MCQELEMTLSVGTPWFDGRDRATSVCNLYAWHRYREGDGESELWAQYHHAFHRENDFWRISRLVLRAAGMRNFYRAQMHPIGRKELRPSS